MCYHNMLITVNMRLHACNWQKKLCLIRTQDHYLFFCYINETKSNILGELSSWDSSGTNANIPGLSQLFRDSWHLHCPVIYHCFGVLIFCIVYLAPRCTQTLAFHQQQVPKCPFRCSIHVWKHFSLLHNLCLYHTAAIMTFPDTGFVKDKCRTGHISDTCNAHVRLQEICKFPEHFLVQYIGHNFLYCVLAQSR